MKKALIITYYWPPSGGAGVQRWLKFVKYLRNFGWEPIIYTPENPEAPDLDETLVNDIPKDLVVLKKRVWEPYLLYKWFTGKKRETKITHGFLKEEGKQGLSEKIAVWMRGNFFIPDARCFWIRPSIKFLGEYLKTNPVDVIVSTGPPHSMHLISLGLKRKYDLPWLADFRDPWTEIDYYHKLSLTRHADRQHKKLEKQVLTHADVVLAVGNHLASRLAVLGASNTHVITNGYDEDDFSFMPVQVGAKFTITHLGSLNKDRNPEILWEAVAQLCSDNEEFNLKLNLRFIGKVDYSLRESLAGHGLVSKSEFYPYLPHIEALKLASSSAVLLLLINQAPNQEGIITGKIFEYLASNRPILCVGPLKGEVNRILQETKAGVTMDYHDLKTMKQFLLEHFRDFQSGVGKDTNSEIGKYSRLKLTEQLAGLLNELIRT